MFTLVCIPAFNEESVISNLVKESSKYSDSVVVCDDGSFDNTAYEAEKAGAFVIKLSKNLGKGAAIKSLFNFARHSNADLVITIDGDAQFLPKEIPILKKPIEEEKTDIVIGYRFDSTTDMPEYRKFGNAVLDKMTNLASDLPFRDTQSGFRSYSKNAINLIEFSSSGFGADSEILIDASKKGLKISEQKITVIYKTGGKTSTKNPISHTSEVISSILELILTKHPLKFLGVPGILLLILGGFFAANVMVIFNETRYFSIPFTLVTISIFGLGLMLLFVSGILFSLNKYRNSE